jgi:Ca-activated chloride channel homolog
MRYLLLGLVSLGACGGGSDVASFGYGGGTPGGFGATTGGVKDMKLARELIANGEIPPPSALLVEAMFAEHDLGLAGEPCPRTLCLRGAAGYAPDIDGTPRGWAQVGLSSTIDPATWTRPSTTFVFVVDISGSMQWGRSDPQYPPASQLARATMQALVDQLRADDRVAIVTFGDNAATAMALTPGDQHVAIHAAVSALAGGGSTNMEAGMKLGYEVGATAVGSTAQTRVIVFTDTQPNVGATTPTEFENMVGGAEDGGVATTVLDFGLGIDPDVLRGMAALRGANAYSMSRLPDIDDFIANDYPWFTTPVAYDLKVDAKLSSGWLIQRGLGFPAATDAQTQLAASTVFLSQRKGALLVALLPPALGSDQLSGGFHLQYTEPSGTAVTDEVPFGFDRPALDARGQWFAQHGIARTAALGLFTEAMHTAATSYSTGDYTGAEHAMIAAQDRFAADAAALGDTDLPVEVDLGASLLGLIQARAPQGTLYGP